MAKSNGPFIVIYGEDSFSIERFISERKNLWSKRNILCADGDGLTDSNVVDLFESNDLFDDRLRAVVLDNASDIKGIKGISKYISEKDPKDLSCVVLVVVRSKSIPSLWQEAVKKGVSVEFSKPKPWETDKHTSRIDAEAGRLQMSFSAGSLELFYRYVKDDLRAASNELMKLSYVVGPDKVVRPEHIALVTAAHITVAPYEVAEAAIEKEVVKAMRLMSLVYKDQGDSCLVPVAYALMRQVEQALIMVDMSNRADPVSVISARLSMNEYLCKRKLPVAQRHTTRSLVGHMKTLCKLDSQIKGTAKSKRTLVELAVLAIAS